MFCTGFLESCVEFGHKVDTGVPEIVVLHQSSGGLWRVLPDSGHSSLSVCQPYSPGGMWHYCLGRTAAGEYAGQPLETGCASYAQGLAKPAPCCLSGYAVRYSRCFLTPDVPSECFCNNEIKKWPGFITRPLYRVDAVSELFCSCLELLHHNEHEES